VPNIIIDIRRDSVTIGRIPPGVFAMRALACLIVAVVVAPVAAQVKTSDPARKMLYDYLLAEAQKHFDARRAEIAKLQTPGDVENRQRILKEKFLAALGGFPEKTPLNPKVVGTIQADGFKVEKVIYESRPDHHVTANLYLPAGKGPFPGVLVPCGHSANGKAAEAYQRVCILMAKNGLAVLCYDPIGQGERLQLLKDGKPAIPGSTSEHTMVGLGALLVGQSTATYRIWDGIRSLDYLASRPEIDPKRLGCTGNSGGGTLTAYLMALDERIACAAPSCYLTTLERLFATIGPQDAEQNITGQVAFGMEHADYITLRAPRPTLMCVATQDFFDIGGAHTTFKEASRIYKLMGAGERASFFEFDDKHGFSKPRREAATAWMCRWLLGKEGPVSEGEFPSFKDAELQCTRSGQVLDDFKGRSVFHLNGAAGKALAGERAKFAARPVAERQRELKRLLGVTDAHLGHTAALPTSTPVATEEKFTIHQIAFTTEPGIRLPGFWYNRGKGHGKLIAYFPAAGMPEDGCPAPAIDGLVRGGAEVLAVDLRGLGATSPAAVGAKPSFFSVDFKHSFLSIHLNRPLLGQRVLDIHALLRHADVAASAAKGLHLYGDGLAGLAVLHAAALLERKDVEITLEGALVAWQSVLDVPICYNQLSSVIPGALKAYDLPDLAATLAPRKLTIRQPLDAAQRPVGGDALAGIYARCREAYATAGAAGQLSLSGD
jgi:dienelactone hydrolase